MRIPLVAAVLVVASTVVPASADPAPPQNPYTAPNGFATMHGNSASSGVTPVPGPVGPVAATRFKLASACPNILALRGGQLVALCTRIIDRVPVVLLLDPVTGDKLAEHEVAKGTLFGGTYDYLDQNDRVVLVDGKGDLLRIGAHREGGRWRLRVDESTPLGSVLDEGCDKPGCDPVVGIAPDWSGRVWFATGRARVGTVHNGRIHTIALGAGERVANGLSTAPSGVAITSDHALYLLGSGDDGTPTVRWRYAYDRGPARKPGQLSHGSGSTPVFFGPGNGHDYLTIMDNAAPRENLIVLPVDRPEPVCVLPVDGPAGKGSEDAPIAVGRSVYLTGTYGYDYPALPEDAGTSEPKDAPFEGGLTRVDVTDKGCATVWSNSLPVSALSKLSTADNTLYTVTRSAGLVPSFAYAAIDAATGVTVASRPLGSTFTYDPIQMSGLIGADGTFYQGTTAGVVRVAASG